MNRILIIGGFGAVGRATAASLRGLLPDTEVPAAGRNPTPVWPADATAMRLDATDDNDVAAALHAALRWTLAGLGPDIVVTATRYRPALEPLVGYLGVLETEGMPDTGPNGSPSAAAGLWFLGHHPSLDGNLRQQPAEARRIASAISRAATNHTPLIASNQKGSGHEQMPAEQAQEPAPPERAGRHREHRRRLCGTARPAQRGT